MTEAEILQRTLLALGSRPDCTLWRNNTGKLLNPRTGRWVSFGLPGSGDALGILQGGRFLAIETKTARGQLRPEQIAFRAMVERRGGLYVLARSVDDAVEEVDRAVA